MTDIDITDWARDAAAEIEREYDGKLYLLTDERIGETRDCILHHADPLIAALQSAIEERDMLKRELESYAKDNHSTDASNMVAEAQVDERLRAIELATLVFILIAIAFFILC